MTLSSLAGRRLDDVALPLAQRPHGVRGPGGTRWLLSTTGPRVRYLLEPTVLVSLAVAPVGAAMWVIRSHSLDTRRPDLKADITTRLTAASGGAAATFQLPVVPPGNCGPAVPRHRNQSNQRSSPKARPG